MKAHYKAFGGKLLIEVEGSNIKELFKQIGPVAEVLDGDDCCGACGSHAIYPRARDAKKADGKVVTYYELVCSTCTAKLTFGQHSEGSSMWAKRTDDQGNVLDHRGWKKYLALPAGTAPKAAREPERPSAAPADPRLKLFFDRCTDIDATSQVFGEICDMMRDKAEDAYVSAAWERAIKAHGDPAVKPASVRLVLQSLLHSLAHLEAKG